MTLQLLVHKGVITRQDALDIVDRSIEAAGIPSGKETSAVAEMTQDCLRGVRNGLAEMPTRQ